MGIEVNTKEGVYHTRIDGDLTIYTAGEYRDVLLEKCHTHQDMELDLEQVTEMDTAGLQLLVALKKHLGGMGCDLRLPNPGKTVREVLEFTRLADEFSVDKGEERP